MLLAELCAEANEVERRMAARRPPLSTYKIYTVDTLLRYKPISAVRFLMQEYGTDVRRRDNPSHWVDAWRMGVRSLGMSDPLVVAPDVRFHNEAVAVREVGGTIWRVTRPGVEVSAHESEQAQTTIRVDGTIVNDGSLADLEAAVCRLWEVFSGKKQPVQTVRG